MASALALRWGVGLFVLMIGSWLTWLSFRGYLWRLQTNTARPKVFGGAWLLFAVSLALPAMTVKGCNNQTKTYRGWELAYLSAAMAIDTPSDVAADVMNLNVNPDRLYDALGWCATLVALNLPNVMMLLSPWVLWRQQRGKGAILSWLFGMAATFTWYWGWQPDSEEPDMLRVGYYVWSGGVTAIFLAHRPGVRTLVSMALLAATIVCLYLLR